MKSNSIVKVALIIGISCLNLTMSQKLLAFEPFTWSELVTGNKAIKNNSETLNVVTEWCGLQRILKSNESNFAKLRNSNRIIDNYEKYSDEAYFKAVMDLRYLYLYSYKDINKADQVLSLLDKKPGLINFKSAETIFSSFKSENILSDKFYEELYTLKNKANIFPYNNGYMPEISNDHATLMLGIKEMIEGKGKQNELNNIKCWNNIPAEIIYNIATDQRENAFKLYTSYKNNLDDKSKKLIEDFLYPLYMPVKKADRKFLAGLFCIEVFPGLGMDLINESLTDSHRVSKPEHALACLSNVYMKHNAHNEAQKVFSILSECYPESVWLK